MFWHSTERGGTELSPSLGEFVSGTDQERGSSRAVLVHGGGGGRGGTVCACTPAARQREGGGTSKQHCEPGCNRSIGGCSSFIGKAQSSTAAALLGAERPFAVVACSHRDTARSQEKRGIAFLERAVSQVGLCFWHRKVTEQEGTLCTAL